jgi:hypothetical protein
MGHRVLFFAYGIICGVTIGSFAVSLAMMTSERAEKRRMKELDAWRRTVNRYENGHVSE